MSKLLNNLLTTLSQKQKTSTSKSTPKKKKSKPSLKPQKDKQELESTAKEIISLAREEAEKLRNQAREEISSAKKTLKKVEQNLKEQKTSLKKQETHLVQKRQSLKKTRQTLERKSQKLDEVRAQQLEKLEKIANLSKSQAKKLFLSALEKQLTKEAAERIRENEENIKQESDQKAKEILVSSMYHGATDYVAEYTVSTLKLPKKDIKGRIIGKDGRNIRAFEKSTGVDLDMDETPGEVRLSCFDPVRREIARIALKRLIKDGRIQPTRIEEYVKKAKKEIDKTIFKEGKKLCHKVGAYNVPHDLIALLGRFKYRTSYGQNMISHTLEETKIGMKLAEEVGADVNTVRMGCLFHDIGKVINEEGSHVNVGVKLLKKHGIDQKIIDTVAQHHEDEEFTSVESTVVYIADAISGARPGARYENYEEYVNRLEKLEEIASSKKGVDHVFAIQAGREVRVIVNPQKITDDKMVKLAHDIKKEIKESVTYPGTVTVKVIRETRVSDVAN